MGKTYIFQLIGAFTLWLFSGFKQPYKYYFNKYLLSVLVGVIAILIVFYILIMYTNLFKMK